ncbi:hypothetical protein [Nocardia sp. XZ_19_385]|uniref:hypothetical protein n=1 Tax=Nocardia sp. XZ_19_385 TaxID=2769488 RepID=UPI0018906269|nr:hypothetical protein [Nocardia sp. XZ_19_385]
MQLAVLREETEEVAIAINTRYLDLSNTVANHPPVRACPQGQAASELIATGAHHVGFALIAVGLAEWGAEPTGHAEMQTRLANQQFDTMSLAPISYAAAAAMSCLDVCAAATYRLCVGAPNRGHELDLRSLEQAQCRGRSPIALPPNLDAWVKRVLADPDYSEIEAVRHQVVHRHIGSTSMVGAAPGRTTFRVGNVLVTPEYAANTFTRFAERYYEKFIAAVLADF